MDYSKTSFEPISDGSTTTLILGTIPGDRSLELGEYYGHPQNRFWKTIAALTSEELPTAWPDKKALMLRHGLGLWDVAHKAIRKGSLDSAIRDVKPNDIAGFLARHPGIEMVVFNGKTAEKLHDRYFGRLPGIEYVSLPSTSPANAAFTLEKLCDRWRYIAGSATTDGGTTVIVGRNIARTVSEI